jgi:NADPH:quinone reductase-like Zn-dependent oxidoreductase
MKAWQIQKHGGPEVLKRIDISSRIPGPHEAKIRVEAVGLNHLDLWVQKGVPGHKFPLPMIPGCDISGVITEFGPGPGSIPGTGTANSQGLQKDLQIGSPVIINPGTSCGRCEACLSGFDPLCRYYGIIGETQDGGCTEEVIVPIQNLIPRPASISAVQGACLPIPFLTAWTMLTRKASLRPGETILIQAGGSGVSTAAIQIAKMLGATVITTVGSDSKALKAKALGADFVIQYKNAPFREEVKKITQSLGKKGCEIVIDHIGADTFQDSLKCLSWGGRFVTCGATSGGNVELDLKAVFFKNLSILGSTMGSKADMIRIVDLVAQGKLKPIVDSVFPMSDLPKAFEKLEARDVFGKVILQSE